MIPLYYLWIIFEKMASRFKKNWMSKIAFSAFLFVGSAYTLAGVKELSLEEYLLLPADYGTYFEMQCIEWNGIKIYAPKNGDQGNYEEFPAIPYSARLELIEFCGDDMGDGFRMKEIYRDKKVTPYGDVLD